jgi:hypothetical protein
MKMKMFDVWFVSSVNLLQRKLMKVNNNWENMRSKELQHCVELQLIEVMNLKMLQIQFVPIVNMVRMKLMKVTCNRKNMMNKEFQHCVESELIEAMIVKMLIIQFVSGGSSIQTKSRKVVCNFWNSHNSGLRSILESTSGQSPLSYTPSSSLLRLSHPEQQSYGGRAYSIQLSLFLVVDSRPSPSKSSGMRIVIWSSIECSSDRLMNGMLAKKMCRTFLIGKRSRHIPDKYQLVFVSQTHLFSEAFNGNLNIIERTLE